MSTTLINRRECEHVYSLNGETCDAPPGMGITTRATCFACGMQVCKACSEHTRWYGFGIRRVAYACIEEHRR